MGQRARHIIGLAFLWPLLTMEKTALGGFENQLGVVGMGPLAFVFSVAIGLGAALALAAPARLRAAEPARARTWLLALGALSSGLLALSETPLAQTPARLALGLLAALVCALVLCALTLAWAQVAGCASAGGRTSADVLADACVSLFGSFVIRLAYALVLGSPVAGTLGVALRAAYPLLACLAWRAATRDAEPPAASPLGDAGAAARRATRSPMLRLAVVAGVFVLLTCVLVGVRAGGYADYPIDVSGRRYLLALPFSAVLVALALATRRWRGLWLLPWGATLLFVFAGALLAMTATGTLARTGVDAMIVGRLSLWALFWTLPAQLANPVRATAALYLLPQAVAYCLTDALYLLTDGGHATTAALDAASVIVVVALMACALVAASMAGALSPARQDARHEGSGPKAEAPTPAPDLGQIRSAACRELARRFGLTERETVVLELVSQGRTVPQIAQEQGVSQNTVRTHTKGLYRKLDCHTKQDVMDAVARQMEDLARRG